MFVSCERVKAIVMARTERCKILFEERLKGSPLPPLGIRETLHMHRKAACGSKVKG